MGGGRVLGLVAKMGLIFGGLEKCIRECDECLILLLKMVKNC